MPFKNFRKLAGRTFLITGASRGIGKAIALKAARDGANIVIASETAESHTQSAGINYLATYMAAKESITEFSSREMFSCINQYCCIFS